MGRPSRTPGGRERIVALCVGLCLIAAFGSVEARGPQSRLLDARAVERWVAPPIDIDALVEQDALEADGRRPLRAGVVSRVSLSPDLAGRWQAVDTNRWRWTLPLDGSGALWLVLGFDRMQLPEGAALSARSPDGALLAGPYTAADLTGEELWLPPIAAERFEVHLDWPQDPARHPPSGRLSTVSQGYRPWGSAAEQGFAGTDCHVDINCPSGAGWEDERRGVVRLLVTGSQGSAFCSGSLINNSGLDCKPYVLTAEHCYDGPGLSPASTVFLFDYELTACEPGAVPTDRTISGSTLRASHVATDHRLLELSSPIPAGWDVYFNGWSRALTPPSSAVTIHHPMGDLKKISTDDDPLIDGIDQGPDHWRVVNWDEGSTDPGSSGAPLLDPDGRIIGELHVDTASCANPSGYAEYGKLNTAWSQGFSGWLDPLATGSLTLEGMDQSFCGAPTPRLRLDSTAVDDSGGFVNGHADPGEAFVLEVALFNEGPLPATTVTGTLTTSHPLVSIVDGSASWPDIAAAEFRDFGRSALRGERRSELSLRRIGAADAPRDLGRGQLAAGAVAGDRYRGRTASTAPVRGRHGVRGRRMDDPESDRLQLLEPGHDREQQPHTQLVCRQSIGGSRLPPVDADGLAVATPGATRLQSPDERRAE